MRINYSCIYWVFVVLLAFQSAYGQTEAINKNTQNILANQSDLRMVNLKKQASELSEAYNKGNVDEFIELIHPKMLEKDFSRESFAKILKDVLEFEFGDYENFRSSVESSNELFEIDSQLFSVIPFKLEGTNSMKNKVVKLSSIVGVSSDNGKSWKFVTGRFSELFPNTAGRVQIPSERRFVNDKEQ